MHTFFRNKCDIHLQKKNSKSRTLLSDKGIKDDPV